jgi:hypothetical protein
MAMRTTRLFLIAATAVLAADTTLTFRLAQDPANLPDCMQMAPSFERPYTLVVAGGTATLTSAGGVSIGMTAAGPDTYRGVFELSGERLDYTAELGATRTLSVRGNTLGCKWLAKAD